MKRTLILALAILTVFCCASLASAQTDGYWVDLQDEISVALNENIRAYFGRPEGSGWISIVCSDPAAFQDLGVGYTDQRPYRFFFMKALGQYTLQFTDGNGFSKTVLVRVETPATAIHPEQDTVVVQVGQTVPVRYTMEGGTYYDPFPNYTSSALFFDPAGETPTVTGLRTGFYQVTARDRLASFGVFVVDACEGVKLHMPYDKGTVGYSFPITTTDRQGKTVYARVELTEGEDCAELCRDGGSISLKGKAAGWVTVKAYGTDGSTDEARLRIYESPTDVHVTLSSQTIPAGERLTVSAEYEPAGAWYPLKISSHNPDAEGLEGPVAVVDGNVIIGITPGVCTLEVYAAGSREYYPIKVTDSDQALVFDRPQPYLNYGKPYQLSVHTRAGELVPAEYSVEGASVSVTGDGLLSASTSHAIGYVTVTLQSGLTYRFRVEAAECPAWLAPEAEIISMPIDIISCDMCCIKSDMSDIVSITDLVLCSSDESVVKVDNWRIYPQSVGTATLTVWSQYNDVSCTVPVVVTEPYGRLFVDGVPDDASISIAYNTTVPLPTVTDYWGNPVKVTWEITHQSSYPSGKRVVQIVNGKSLKCTYYDGSAELYATAASGQTLHLTVFAYQRDTTCSFRESEYTVTTGSFVQVDFQYGNDLSNPKTLEPQDVTFTVTGDTDCVIVDSQFSHHTFTGLREGTVTLTAKLYNGKTAKAVIHVVLPESCKNGHDPEWYVREAPTAILNGVRALRCSRCRVPLGQEEAIPCTGALGFALPDVYLKEGGVAVLTATLNGNPKESFTYRSSNPDAARVVGSVVMGVGLGTADITVTKGDCEPAVCRVHVIPVTTLTLPAGLLHIEDGAFQGVSVTRIVLPEHVTAIGAYAFADCPRLMELAIPVSVTQIGENAFAHDPFLTLTVTPGSFAEQYCIARKLAYRYAGD